MPTTMAEIDGLRAKIAALREKIAQVRAMKAQSANAQPLGPEAPMPAPFMQSAPVADATGSAPTPTMTVPQSPMPEPQGYKSVEAITGPGWQPPAPSTDRTQTIPELLGAPHMLDSRKDDIWDNAVRALAGIGISTVELPRKLLSPSIQDKKDALNELSAMIPNLRGDVRQSLGEVLGPLYDAVAAPLGDTQAHERNKASGYIGPAIAASMVAAPFANKIGKAAGAAEAVMSEARGAKAPIEPTALHQPTKPIPSEPYESISSDPMQAREMWRREVADAIDRGETVPPGISKDFNAYLEWRNKRNAPRETPPNVEPPKQSVEPIGPKPTEPPPVPIQQPKPLPVAAGGEAETLYRGEGGNGSKVGGKYYSPDREFARQFTHSGQDSEVKTITVKSSDIYEPKESVYAGDPDAIDAVVKEARNKGFKAVRLDEGTDQPKSVYLFDRSAGRSSAHAKPTDTPTPPAVAAKEVIQETKAVAKETGGTIGVTESREKILAKIDEAMPKAKTRAENEARHEPFKGKSAYVPPKLTIDIPGDGTFTIENSVESLTEFRKRVSAEVKESKPSLPSFNKGYGGSYVVNDGGFSSAIYPEKAGVLKKAVKEGDAQTMKRFGVDFTPASKTKPTEMNVGITPEQAGRALEPFTPDFLKQARNRMGKSNHAKQLADLIEKKADPASNRRAGQELEAMRTAGLKGIDGAKLADDMEAGKAPAFKKIMDRMYYKAKSVGLDIAGYRDNYFPRSPKEDIRQILYDDLRTTPEKVGTIEALEKSGELSPVTVKVLKHLIETGQAKSASGAWSKLRTYVDNEFFRPFANLEKSRTIDLPLDMYERDAKIVLPRYVRAWAKRLAEVETFGPNGEMADNLVNHIHALNPREGRVARQVVDSWTGKIDSDRPLHPTIRKASDAYTNIQMGTKISLGFSTLKNVFQTAISTAPRAGFARTAKSALRLFSGERRSMIRRSGATIQTAHDALSGRQPSGPLASVTSRLSRISGFEGINKVNQYVAASTAMDWVPELHKMANGRGSAFGRLAPEKSATRAQNILRDEFGIDYKKPLTENQKLEATYRFATDSQLQHNVLSDPLSANDPRFRPLWLFKRFGYRQAAFIKDKIIKQEFIQNDNPLPLLRLAVGGVVSGALAMDAQKWVKQFVSGQKRDDQEYMTKQAWDALTKPDKQKVIELAERSGDAFANIGGMGVVSDILAAEDKLRQAGFMSTPIQVSDATKMWDIVSQINEDWDKYDLKGVAQRAVKPVTKLVGSLPAQLGQRFQTEGQRKGEEANWKGKRRSEMIDAIIEKDQEKATKIMKSWNDAHPSNPIIGPDEDIYDLIVERMKNKAIRKANP